jgi:hypothetical protein
MTKINWLDVFDEEDIKHGKRLYKTFNRECDEYIWAKIGKPIARAAHGFLGGMHKKEIKQIAALMEVKPEDVLAANLIYDVTTLIGCSSFAYQGEFGMEHGRCLDWDFPNDYLKKYVGVYEMPGDVTDYKSVTWPGLLGTFTAVKPKGFSVSVNQVTSPRSIWDALLALSQGAYPVSWAVREVMETAEGYKDAIDQLKSIPLLAPALFLVCGVTKEEGAVVIERTPTKANVRWCDSNFTLSVTNHTKIFEQEEEDEDSIKRLTYLERHVKKDCDAFKILGSKQILSACCQYQVRMHPHNGDVFLRVPGGTTRCY